PNASAGIGMLQYLQGSCTSGSPSSPDLPITFPTDSFASVNVFDTKNIYVTGTSPGTTENGETVHNLDGFSPTSYHEVHCNPCDEIYWKTTEGLVIGQTIWISGTTAPTSFIDQQMWVYNNSTTPHTVGVRFLWDYFVNSYDGTWIREYNGVTPGAVTPGAILGVETGFDNPGSTMTAYALGPCSSTATPPTCNSSNFGQSGGNTSLTAYASISSLNSIDGIAAPSQYFYGYRGAQAGTAFFYTPNSALCDPTVSPNQIGSFVTNVDSCQDSSSLYYFGGPNGTTLAPQESVRYDATITNALSAITLETPEMETQLSNSAISPGGSVHDSAKLLLPTSTAGGTVTYYYTTDSSCKTGGVQVGSPVTVTDGIVPNSAF
ncbi:MAG: hypothetical protein OK455_06105, partial [Thaumarchaeota archaeon]|nr:hypothetical protein [Nitrososphaerota archaeon]